MIEHIETQSQCIYLKKGESEAAAVVFKENGIANAMIFSLKVEEDRKDFSSYLTKLGYNVIRS